MRSPWSYRRTALLATIVILPFTGCTDTETVFVERPFFDDPPGNAAGFIGYGTEDARLASFTVCGNCHIGSQSQWENTAHAHAWETLAAIDQLREPCVGCHSVNERGNAAEGDVGWTATADARFEDVQCESCHGPGAGHLSNPEASQPLATIAVGLDLSSGCGECHSGSHHPFVDEWVQSRHGEGGNASIRTRDECTSCHEGRGALEAFGVDADYIEKDGSEPQPIVCSVCHDPHSAQNEHQLRFPINVPDIDQNLCMKCHQRRAVPDPTSSRGPHSPQGPLLLGEDVGWTPPNFDTNIVRGTHGSAQNEELCATCHVNAFEVTDPATGGFVFSATGHLFQPIPCLDASGVPTVDGNCALTERTFASCTGAGCHGDETVARTLFTNVKQRIANLVAQLDAQLAGVPASEFSTSDNVLTVAEGAKFNQDLAEISSSAIHNPFLTEALLLGSMQAVQSEYGIAPNITRPEIERRLAEITVGR